MTIVAKTMKIKDFYYLDYPDRVIENPSYAATEMRVELAPEVGPEDYIEASYAFMVYTFAYITDKFFAVQLPVVGKAIMIVSRLDDDWMFEFLCANIGNLGAWGEQIE